MQFILTGSAGARPGGPTPASIVPTPDAAKARPHRCTTLAGRPLHTAQ